MTGTILAGATRGMAGRVWTALAAVALLAGCTDTGRSDATPAERADRAIVLAPGDGGAGLATTSDEIEVAALTTDGPQNGRDVFWPRSMPAVADGVTCATWTDQLGDTAQQGAALRIRSANGRVRALTVTKNVVWGATWGFNFHTWDTDRERPWVKFDGLEVHALRGSTTAPFPWHFCARVRGRAIEFKVWPDEVAEPAWGDPRWSGASIVPAGWSAPGQAGWYVGHLGPGDRARFDDLRIGDAERPSASTDSSQASPARCPETGEGDLWCRRSPVIARG
jgi:hypothetical protein